MRLKPLRWRRPSLALSDVPPRYRSTYFAHIWGGDYGAGYYAYLWAEMLDDDAFQWFEDHGGLTRANGDRLRRMVLSRGNTEDLANMYKAWLGAEPSIEPDAEIPGPRGASFKVRPVGTAAPAVRRSKLRYLVPKFRIDKRRRAALDRTAGGGCPHVATSEMFPAPVPRNACRSCSCVFITIGPYHATGSSQRLSRDQQEPDPVVAGLHRHFVAAVEEHERAVVGLDRRRRCPTSPPPSVGTASGPDALQNFPPPANT